MEVPDYCKYYKPLLVENFTMIPSPFDLHYGKCALIGRTIRDPRTLRMYLGSIRLIGLQREYQCTDGTTRVLLHTIAGCRHDLPADETVRVYGEATFYDRNQDDSNVVLMTVKDLIQIANMADEHHDNTVDAVVSDREAAARLRYEPCMTVHSFNVIDQPHEMLQMQLRLSAIQSSAH